MTKPTIEGAIAQTANGVSAQGGVAHRLLSANGDLRSLRTNDVLQYDEWKYFDTELLRSYRDNLIGVAHLKERGLIYDLGGKGMNFTVMQSQSMSNAGNAHMTMTGLSRGESDIPEFDIQYFPLPIIASDWFIDYRHLAESRNKGTNLDTTMVEQNGEEIAQFQEDILFNGYDEYSFGGGTLYGYTDYPHRHQGTLNGAWDDAGTTGKNILDDLRNMLDDLTQDKQRGPYGVYIPADYQSKLTEDYIDNYPKTIRQRIQELDNRIEFIEVSDKLSDDNVVMVQLNRKTVRMVTGLALTNFEWGEQGGFALKWKSLTIDVPQIRSDHDDRCGIAHYVAPAT